MFVRSITILFILLAGLSIAIPKTTQAQLVYDEARLEQEKKWIDKMLLSGKAKRERHGPAMKHLRAAREAFANNDLKACKKALKEAKRTRKEG